MKRMLFSFLLCIPLWLYGDIYIPYSDGNIPSQLPQRAETTAGNSVIIEYNFPGCMLSVVDEGGETYAIPRINGFGMAGEVGGPALPYYRDFILVSDTSATVQILSSNYQEVSDYLIYPEQPPRYDSDTTTIDFYRDSILYSRNSFTPGNIVEKQGVQIMKGMPLMQIAVQPVQYNPVTRKMRCYTQIRYKVTSSTPSAGLTTDSASFSFLKGLICNPSMLQHINATECADRMLVVTADEFLDPVTSYMQWKRSTGFEYRIISKAEWLNSEEVKDSIHTAYSRQAFDYLLIVGDHEDVPAKYVENLLGNIYTDLRYACMDGAEDYTADVGRGRIPVNNVDEARLVLNRIKQLLLMR